MPRMAWQQPLTVEEQLKARLVPPGLYIRYLYAKALRRGERELHLLPHLARRDKISLDIGANKGVYSYALRGHSRAVHAFEPNPKPLATLRAWGHGRIHIHPTALSDHSGAATLRVPKTISGYSNQGASLSATKVAGAHAAVHVDSQRLDDLDLRDVGFVKIDVEGFEREVLRGAAATLRRERPNLLIELEERHTRVPLPDLIAEVCDYGYDAFALIDGQLRNFAHIDLDRHHRNPASKSDYVFNFIFLPRDLVSPPSAKP